MNKLRISLGILIAFLPTSLFGASIDQVSAYLSQLTNLKSEFTQFYNDQNTGRGTIYLRRPGRARFEYSAPSKSLVLIGGSQISIFDGKSNAGPQQYPLSSTPLSILLSKHVNLARSGLVKNISATTNTTSVILQDPENAEIGTIEMQFSHNPLQLTGWTLTDAGGTKIAVQLDELETNATAPNSLFSATLEIQKRKRD